VAHENLSYKIVKPNAELSGTPTWFRKMR